MGLEKALAKVTESGILRKLNFQDNKEGFLSKGRQSQPYTKSQRTNIHSNTQKIQQKNHILATEGPSKGLPQDRLLTFVAGGIYLQPY